MPSLDSEGVGSFGFDLPTVTVIISPKELTPSLEKKLFKIYLSGARAAFQIMWKIGEEETLEDEATAKVEALFQELISLGEGA